MDIREEMALLALDGRYTVMEVAGRFGVTPPTVRLWRDRFRQSGRSGLEDRSHAPHSCPRRTTAAIEQLVIADREQWGFGSKKILRRLQDAYPELELPKRSTIDAILSRHGLVQRQRPRRVRAQSPFRRRYVANEPGELITLDHKGEFRLRNGRYCYPLTIMDHVSRYVLACEALDSTSYDRAWPVIERVLRQEGLPRAIQSDNGPPFGAANGKFSRLSVELMRLDVLPVFSRPGVPQDNGRHERMHRDLQALIIAERMASLIEQQKQFDRFCQMFNLERPHEGLQMKRPADVYTPPSRPFPRRRPKPEYEPHWETRTVSERGTIKWKNEAIFIGHPFTGEIVALEPTEVDLWSVRFYNFVIGKFDQRRGQFV